MYEPYLANGNASILNNRWQAWDAFEAGSQDGGWWASNAAGQAATGCTPNRDRPPATLAEIQAADPQRLDLRGRA